MNTTQKDSRKKSGARTIVFSQKGGGQNKIGAVRLPPREGSMFAASLAATGKKKQIRKMKIRPPAKQSGRPAPKKTTQGGETTKRNVTRRGFSALQKPAVKGKGPHCRGGENSEMRSIARKKKVERVDSRHHNATGLSLGLVLRHIRQAVGGKKILAPRKREQGKGGKRTEKGFYEENNLRVVQFKRGTAEGKLKEKKRQFVFARQNASPLGCDLQIGVQLKMTPVRGRRYKYKRSKGYPVAREKMLH